MYTLTRHTLCQEDQNEQARALMWRAVAFLHAEYGYTSLSFTETPCDRQYRNERARTFRFRHAA